LINFLFQDNFQDDPHENITWNRAAPKFDDELIFSQIEDKKRKKRSNDPPSKICGPEHASLFLINKL
jgi:hypothetical protein